MGIPGSAEPIAIDDPKAVAVIEDLHPEWEEGKVQRFPQSPNPFAFEVSEKLDPNMDASRKHQYELLCLKERVVECAVKILQKEEGIESWALGRKAVISNLAKSGYEHALSLTNSVPRPIIHQIAELWSVAFELVLTIGSIGVVLLCFREENEEFNYEAIDELEAYN